MFKIIIRIHELNLFKCFQLQLWTNVTWFLSMALKMFLLIVWFWKSLQISFAITTEKVSVFGVTLVRIRENTDQNNSDYGHLLCSESRSDQLLITYGTKYSRMDQMKFMEASLEFKFELIWSVLNSFFKWFFNILC